MFVVHIIVTFQMPVSADTRSRVLRAKSILRRAWPPTAAALDTPSPRTRIRDIAAPMASGVVTLQDANVSRKCHKLGINLLVYWK